MSLYKYFKNASKSTNGTIFKVAASEANLTAVEEDEICNALETVSKGGSKKKKGKQNVVKNSSMTFGMCYPSD